METINVIKDSFELWYNTTVSKENPVSVIISYSDTQTLTLKAYHKASVAMQVVEVVDGVSKVTPFVSLEENYNHGTTTEEEAKENMMKKLLVEIYKYVKLL